MKIRLIYNRYIGMFYRKNKRGRWYKFHQIGNAGVSFDVARMLEKLGHKVEIYQIEDKEEDI